MKTLIDRIADQKVSAESQSLIDKNNSPNSGSGGFYLYGRDRRAKSHYYGIYVYTFNYESVIARSFSNSLVIGTIFLSNTHDLELSIQL